MRALILLAAFLAGILVGALKWRGSAEDFHRQARMAAILAQAQQMPKGGVLVIGDSITERIRFDRLCGLPALNAGIGWSTSSDWLPDARKVIHAARPSIIALAIGANDGPSNRTAHEALAKLATFEIERPASTVDGIHPDAKGAEQFRQAIELGCQANPSAMM